MLIAFENRVVLKCVKRPSAVIKSPYVADVADVENETSETILAHCPSLGLGGILAPGSEMIGTPSTEGSKTSYVVQAVKDGNTWVGNVPLHANRIVKHLLQTGQLISNVKTVKPEHKHGESRLDFLVTLEDGSCVYCEVKSVHIKANGIAVFPVGYKKPKQNTVSERANKHLQELTTIAKDGDKAMIVLVVQRGDCDEFAPYEERDPVFAKLFKEAIESGVLCKVVYTDVSCEGITLRKIEQHITPTCTPL